MPGIASSEGNSKLRFPSERTAIKIPYFGNMWKALAPFAPI